MPLGVMTDVNKQTVFTALGIAAAFAIAIGGWLLTNELLDRNENALLSATGKVQVRLPPENEVPDASDPGSGRETLSYEEIHDALLDWQTEGKVGLGDPVAGQLSMEEAVEAALSGIAHFSEFGISPEGLYRDSKVSAYLYWSMTENEELSLAADPAGAFWDVNLESGDFSAKVLVQATTGQPWEMVLWFPSAVEYPDRGFITKVLSAYMECLGWESGDFIYLGESNKYSYCTIADDGLYAIASYHSGTTVDRTDGEAFACIQLSLTTQLPSLGTYSVSAAVG